MEGSLFLVVGLGNPGSKYENTPHNIGFGVIDELARRSGNPTFQSKFRGLTAQVTLGGQKVILLKPQTYMNLSGSSVHETASFYKIPVGPQVMVITDDLDLPPAALRLRPSGGTGGHNGLKSMVEVLGTEEFPRIRIGVGRSPTLPSDVYLLSPFPKADRPLYEEAIKKGADAVEAAIKDGFAKAMNSFNQRKKPETPPKDTNEP